MVIKIKNTPSNEELLGVLQREFPSDYTFKLFGVGKKSVIVRKSTLLGAQITIRENEISVEASPPSFGSGMLTALTMTELAVVILPIFWLTGAFPSKFRKLEKEIAFFIKERYN